MPWWERYPGELEREIDALEAAGMQPTRNERGFAAGKAIINIRLEVLGSMRDSFIVYPDLYPYFRPAVYVPGMDTGLRHYNPFSGEVCLLRRGTQYWLPRTKAAEHIKEMLPHWERAAIRDYNQPRLENEDEQAEPVTVYYSGTDIQLILLDSSWHIPEGIRSGKMEIAFPEGYKNITPSESYSAWVTGIEDNEKNTIHEINTHLKNWLKQWDYRKEKYPWIRLDVPPIGRNELELSHNLITSSLEVRKHIATEVRNFRTGIYGFCFPEEAPGGGHRDGWLFLAYHCHRLRKKKGGDPRFWIIKPEFAGEKDLFERVPELNPLRNKIVAVLGLGCIGAPSALAMARAGFGELRFLDGDMISAGTTCRWPLGLTVAGMEKVRALEMFISENYPFTRIGTAHYPTKQKNRITLGATDTDYDQWDCLEKLIQGADLIYDATAEQGINLMLNDLAINRKIPYICISSRSGGWGGNVVRVKPNSGGGCFLCYLHALADGQIPHPSYDPQGDELQPVGCGDITFKAAGFDVEEIALAGVRIAASTLCEGSIGGYPAMVNDIGILSLRKNGKIIFPEWQSYPLQKHPKCEICNP